jgi:hypothetical protein
VGRIRRGGYVFIFWMGDHPPRHVHVFENGKEVLKGNLDASVTMRGRATRRMLRLIRELVEEGRR